LIEPTEQTRNTNNKHEVAPTQSSGRTLLAGQLRPGPRASSITPIDIDLDGGLIGSRAELTNVDGLASDEPTPDRRRRSSTPFAEYQLGVTSHLYAANRRNGWAKSRLLVTTRLRRNNDSVK
jgi:hypothetical protein